MNAIERYELSERLASIWRQSRKEADVSQDYMAKSIGVSKKTIQNWEDGTACPTLPKALEWFDVLRVQPFPYIIEILFPDMQGKSDKDILADIIVNYTVHTKNALVYYFYSNHGSDPISVLEMVYAGIFSLLRDKVDVLNSITLNYHMAKINNCLVMPDEVQPQFDLIRNASKNMFANIVSGINRYSILSIADFDEQYQWILKESREKKGVSVKQMSKMLGVNAATVQRWEAGESNPPILYMIEWFQVLDVNPLPYLTCVCFPEFKKEQSEESEELNEKILDMVYHFPDATAKKILALIRNAHGSSVVLLPDIMLAHLQTPLRDRINVVNSIIVNYRISCKEGVPDHIPANIEMLQKSASEAINALLNGSQKYK